MSSPDNNDVIQYNSQTGLWQKRPQPKFGLDWIAAERSDQQIFTGGQWQTYLSLNVTSSSEQATNVYRLNADFLWAHDSASNDARFRLSFNGVALKELRIEPKDSGFDQRLQNNILYYSVNVPAGTYQIDLQARPDSSSRDTVIFQAYIEWWRVS